LKLFEEPQEGVIFVLLAPHGSLLPTLRSRLLNYPETLQQKAAQNFAGAFLKSSSKIRSAEVAMLLKDEEGVRERVRDFLNALETILYAQLDGQKPNHAESRGKKELIEGLEDIAKVRSYTNDRSPSMKMLLEHLALSLPTIH
jgi:hypothetical protein